MKLIRKTIGLFGLCPSCLKWQGIFAFEDYICENCNEDGRDGGGLKKILASILALVASWFGYGEYNKNIDKIQALEQRIEQTRGIVENQAERPLGAGVIDNGIRGIANPKYWSKE